ncbi:PPW family C-terminal domain-containing PPE protein [Mycobacterium novum]
MTQPAGLAELARDEFGRGPRLPMLPDSWGNSPRAEPT